MSSEGPPTLSNLILAGVARKKKASRSISRPPESPVPSLFDSLPRTESEVPSAEEPVLSAVAPLVELPSNPTTSPSGPAVHTEAPKLVAQVWTVAELVRSVRELVERDYRRVTVEGEISNWRPANSGHCYFTLKDGDAQLSVVMFRRSASLLRFKPKDGDSVRLRGQLSVYENRGQMQIIAESMELAGQGALLAAVQALKERLRRDGLFDQKRPLPTFPKCIGIVTSLQGAALRDIVKVCRRRHAAVNLLIFPAAVQGPSCAKEVVAGLRWFSKHKDRTDVVIVARGGGSWEDLHGFDDEGVARAIAACELPVITGIGHATDTTIADAAADVCAPTPSAAAELVTAAHHRVEERVERLQARVLRAGRFELLRNRQRMHALNVEIMLRRVEDSVRRREQRSDELSFRAEGAADRMVRARRVQLERLEQRLRLQDVGRRLRNITQRWQTLQFRLQTAGDGLTAGREQQIGSFSSRLEALSPLRVLQRGYALVYAPDGTLLRDASAVLQGEIISVRVSQGSLRAAVVESTRAGKK